MRISTIPLRSDNRNVTRFEYVSSANWHTASSSSEDNPLTQFTSKEAVLLPHDTLPQAVISVRALLPKKHIYK